ncbi:uncharacterized protein [Diabrotica undecimpunctata]|uniref:uncharacterized protein n=1 Tax=Diabrotica undecimpunctata TaxID=50387 RepID=UPI003B6421D3
MSFKQRLPPENTNQNVGCDPISNTSKRNSGLFAFLKWFKPSTSRESIDTDLQISHSSSCDSLTSSHSVGTVASFSYIAPGDYKHSVSEKCITPGPETDTYKARLKQRDKIRERDKDKNLTLRKKYNLFFNRDSLLKSKNKKEEIENSKSLPLMTRGVMEETQEEINKVVHRRTNSESSKIRKAGAYLHVKGKRKAPQPPGNKLNPQDETSTASLRRKKRLAPQPPTIEEKIMKTGKEKTDAPVYEDVGIICNDSLKLDHGILRPVKESNMPSTTTNQNNTTLAPSSARTSIEAPVSPRAWYKRNLADKIKKDKTDSRYEPIEILPEVQFSRNSSLDLTLEDAKLDRKKEDKRKSGMTFLTNISELDREAYEIVKNKEYEAISKSNISEMPEFMRPKNTKVEPEEWIVSPKRRSARDLIAKFNAITNVRKGVFGSQKDKLLDKQTSLDETKRRQEFLLESHKKRLEEIDKKNSPLMKSESASAIKPKKETPKLERKSWHCPKCNVENEYWRIICHVCSNIKPYFDDFSSSSKTESNVQEKTVIKETSPPKKTEMNFERSKTQIGFSALVNYNNKLKVGNASSSNDEKVEDTKKEEKEKLKKMLIEMKNSLPKRKIAQRKNNVASIIVENADAKEETIKNETPDKTEDKLEVTDTSENTDDNNIEEKTQEEKVADILIGTTTTVYENIKVKKTDNPKPLKVSSSAQTTAAIKQHLPASTISNLLEDQRMKKDFKLMQSKDFENIYSQSSQSAAKMYANLVRNDELSLFFNIPKTVKKDEKTSRNLSRTDSLQINRLLKKLEVSISKGELSDASNIARELALLKVNCSVVRHKTLASARERTKKIQIEMYVEDKVSHRGPFPVDVSPDQTLAQLKIQVEREFEIPMAFQRWILGKELVTDDNARLKDYGIVKEGCPVFLYLVAPEKTAEPEKKLLVNLKDVPSTSKETNFVKPVETKVNGISSSNPFDRNKSNIPKLDLATNAANASKIDQNGLTDLDHTPKIVNVIPKITEIITKIPNASGLPKKEIADKSKILKKETSPPKTEVKLTQKPPIPTDVLKVEIKSSQIPVTVVETVKMEVKTKETPTTTKIVSSVYKSEASVEEKRIDTSVAAKSQASNVLIKPKTPPANLDPNLEVKPIVQHVFPTIQNSYQPQINLDDLEKAVQLPPHKIDLPPPSSSSVSGAEQKIKLLPESTPGSSNTPPKAKEEEDFSDYESKTLKPVKEWECHLCTLLNPLTSNICAVCSTIRLRTKTEPAEEKKQEEKRVKIKPVTLEEEKTEQRTEDNQPQTYMQLLNLDNRDLIENTETFTCLVCFIDIAPREGVTLRECLHQFCKPCLSQTVEFSDEAEVKCPYRDDNYACNLSLQDREIKALVSTAVYDQHLAKSVAQAENRIDNSFHCKTPDCKGWCVYEDNVNEFKCPVCKRTNCLTCQAIHMGINCRQFQERIKDDANLDEDGKKTKAMLEEMVQKGEAIECPTCRVILMKKWGCDWLRCSMCKTEICWVTRGPRWGPMGKGDTSGGCQCGVNGVKCHPKCNYCH